LETYLILEEEKPTLKGEIIIVVTITAECSSQCG
jgi:hypothetical protein